MENNQQRANLSASLGIIKPFLIHHYHLEKPMRTTILLAVLVLFTTLLVNPVAAQIELNSSGHVAVGDGAPSPYYQLRSKYDGTASSRYGVYSTAHGGTSAFGVYGKGSGGSNNYGVYAQTSGSGSNVGVYAITSGSSNYAGYFLGNVTVTGTFTSPSDAQFKQDVVSVERSSALLNLMQLRATRYTFRDEFQALNLPTGEQYGFIAQEVEAVLPQLVRDQVHHATLNEDGTRRDGESLNYKAVDYMKLIPLLVAALQEQQQQIESLKTLLEK